MKLYIWRHPKPIAANGICLGQMDMAVNPRKLKRLANQIERSVRVHKLPKVIWVSPLQRSLRVGEILAQRGFQLNIATELSELSFGNWEGRSWEQISKQEIDEWCDNFASFAPEDGESLWQLFSRVEARLDNWLKVQATENLNTPILAIGHAGWITAAKMISNAQPLPRMASDWPSAVQYGELSVLAFKNIIDQ